MRIVENIISNGHGTLNPSYLFIHETDNPGATALNHVNYWKKNSTYVVHYVCDWTGNVYHCVPDNRKCYHVGNANNKGVGIELCHATNASDFQKTYNTAVEFAAYYLKSKGWDISHMMSHKEAAKKWGGSTHTDPDGYFAQYGKTWSQFKADVSARLGGAAPVKPTNSTSTTPTPSAPAAVDKSSGTVCNIIVQVIVSDLVIRTSPNGTSTGKYTGKGAFTIVRESNGWGLLKSGAGWIYINNPKYVTKPSQTASKPATPVRTHRFNLTVDGSLGTASVKALQSWLGTTQDGIVSGQPASNKKYLSACPSSNWKFVSKGVTGSSMIKALQRHLGIGADGYCGPGTVKAIQRMVGASQDGYLGPNTAKALQRYLNNL